MGTQCEWVVLGWLIAFIFVAAAALRLARFNVQQTRDSRYFQGFAMPDGGCRQFAAGIWVADTHVIQGALGDRSGDGSDVDAGIGHG